MTTGDDELGAAPYAGEPAARRVERLIVENFTALGSPADRLMMAIAIGRDKAYHASKREPRRVRMALELELVLLRDPSRAGGWSYARFELEQPWARNPSLFGMSVLADPHMPRGVWRILADDDALLYDPREGLTLRQILETYK